MRSQNLSITLTCILNTLTINMYHDKLHIHLHALPYPFWYSLYGAYPINPTDEWKKSIVRVSKKIPLMKKKRIHGITSIKYDENDKFVFKICCEQKSSYLKPWGWPIIKYWCYLKRYNKLRHISLGDSHGPFNASQMNATNSIYKDQIIAYEKTPICLLRLSHKQYTVLNNDILRIAYYPLYNLAAIIIDCCNSLCIGYMTNMIE